MKVINFKQWYDLFNFVLKKSKCINYSVKSYGTKLI